MLRIQPRAYMKANHMPRPRKWGTFAVNKRKEAAANPHRQSFPLCSYSLCGVFGA